MFVCKMYPTFRQTFVYILHPRPQRIFLLYEEGKKEALEHFKHVIKIYPTRGHIFQNKLRNTWTVLLKRSALSRV